MDYLGSLQSIVTSNGNNDAGMFETNLRDERFLPFEGTGAISSWRLELPQEFQPFDYKTISDAILHIRYTARQGGDALGGLASDAVRDVFTTAIQSGLGLLFSLRHDFPTEWSAFVNGNADFAIRVRRDYFPYMVQAETLVIDAIELYAVIGTKLTRRTVAVPANTADDLNGQNGHSDRSLASDANVLKRDAMSQIFLIIRYSIV